MEKAHRHLVQWGIRQGYTIEVWGEDEYLDYSGTDFDEAIENVEACDGGTIYLTTVDGEHVAGFRYVFDYDQEAEDTISDWGINPVSEEWCEDYTNPPKPWPVSPVSTESIADEDDVDFGHYGCQNFPCCDLYGCGG